MTCSPRLAILIMETPGNIEVLNFAQFQELIKNSKREYSWNLAVLQKPCSWNHPEAEPWNYNRAKPSFKERSPRDN